MRAYREGIWENLHTSPQPHCAVVGRRGKHRADNVPLQSPHRLLVPLQLRHTPHLEPERITYPTARVCDDGRCCFTSHQAIIAECTDWVGRNPGRRNKTLGRRLISFAATRVWREKLVLRKRRQTSAASGYYKPSSQAYVR